jgi:hypothetical protein
MGRAGLGWGGKGSRETRHERERGGRKVGDARDALQTTVLQRSAHTSETSNAASYCAHSIRKSQVEAPFRGPGGHVIGPERFGERPDFHEGEMPPFDALLGLWRGTTTLKSPSSDPKLAKSGDGNDKAGSSSSDADAGGGIGFGGEGEGEGVGVGGGGERAGAAKGGAAAKAGSGAPRSKGGDAQQTAAPGKGSSGKSVGKATQSKGRGKGSKGSAKPAMECWYKGCFRPKESSQFYVIEEGRQSGQQDWTPLVGKTLCAACYCRYKDRGTLDRAVNTPLPKSAKRCTNKGCEKPEDSTCFFKIEAGRKSGGRDWSALEGEVLCAACYERYRSRGTLERHKNKPLDRSRRRCTYSRCDRPDHGEKFFLIEEGRSSGGKDWSSVVGQVMIYLHVPRQPT